MQEAHSSDGPQGLWVTISELARMKGVSKQALAKRVDRMVGRDQIATRAGERGSKLINVAEFDRVAGETVDAVRALNGAPAAAPAGPFGAQPGDPVLQREQARRAAYTADLAKLDLDERLGKLVPVEGVQAAEGLVADAIVRVLEQMPSRADELAAAVARDGVVGARAFLKQLAHDARKALASAMRQIAEAAPNPAEGLP